MNPKPNQSPPKNKETQKSAETYAWNPEKMLDTLMNNHESVEKNWVEKGLPKLVDDI
jgi:biotin-(acetyl-CoA carboxylase) ligase